MSVQRVKELRRRRKRREERLKARARAARARKGGTTAGVKKTASSG